MNLEILKTVMSNTSYQILLWMVAIDILTGVAKAIKQQRIDSKVSTDGMIRHVLVVIIVTLVSVYGRVLGFEAVAYSVGYFYIASYGISILENADSIGLKLPSVMSQYFNRMRDDYDHRLAKSVGKEKFEVEVVERNIANEYKGDDEDK